MFRPSDTGGAEGRRGGGAEGRRGGGAEGRRGGGAEGGGAEGRRGGGAEGRSPPPPSHGKHKKYECIGTPTFKHVSEALMFIVLYTKLST